MSRSSLRPRQARTQLDVADVEPFPSGGARGDRGEHCPGPRAREPHPGRNERTHSTRPSIENPSLPGRARGRARVSRTREFSPQIHPLPQPGRVRTPEKGAIWATGHCLKWRKSMQNNEGVLPAYAK